MKVALGVFAVSMTFATAFACARSDAVPTTGSESSDDLAACIDADTELSTDDLTVHTTWQWQLQGDVDISLDVSVFVLDMFGTNATVVRTLKERGHLVMCQFSAGTFEAEREDAPLFSDDVKGNTVDGWADERWLNVTSEKVLSIMSTRLDRAQDLGCNGVVPDNVDGYTRSTGFSIAAEDQLRFNRFLAEEAHHRMLSIGLKNDIEQIDALAGCFDWALNESCLIDGVCEHYKPFGDANKAVLHVEYVDSREDGLSLSAQVCGQSAIRDFSTLIKDRTLSSWGIPCP